MSNYLDDVAIIGAGLGGCALAVALSQHNIPVRIYESRNPDSEVLASGVVLTPNGLRVLDRLEIFDRIKGRCYVTTHRTFKNSKDETVFHAMTTSEELYGYRNHRLWRRVLLYEMRQMLVERNVPIIYNSKFNGIVSDDADGVAFGINEETHHASLLIGSDGIYSAVRKHIAPEVKPWYTGVIGVLSHIKYASVDWPYENYERNATIQDKPGAIFWIGEDPTAEDIMIGYQVQYPEQSRNDLEKLQADKDKLVGFYQKDYDQWGPTCRSIIDRVVETKENCFIWPFMRMPALPKWYSETGRVIIVADGAHALPPSSGQGVNQALEDVYSLTLLLTSVCKKDGTADKSNGTGEQIGNSEILEALAFWQQMRQKRIDAVFDFATNTTNVDRMSEAERQKVMAERKTKQRDAGQSDDMSWLYKPNLEEAVRAWVDGRAVGSDRQVNGHRV